MGLCSARAWCRYHRPGWYCAQRDWHLRGPFACASLVTERPNHETSPETCLHLDDTSGVSASRSARQATRPPALSETHSPHVATQSRRTLQSKSPAKHRSVDVTGPLLRRCVLTGRPRSPVRVGSCLPPVCGTATIDPAGTGNATTGIRAGPLHAHLLFRSGLST